MHSIVAPSLQTYNQLEQQGYASWFIQYSYVHAVQIGKWLL